MTCQPKKLLMVLAMVTAPEYPSFCISLIQRYEQLVNQYDLVVTNSKLREFVQNQATGFGMELKLTPPEVAATVLDAPSQSSVNTEAVTGQKLEKVEQTQPDGEKDYTLWWLMGGCLMIILAGFFRSYWRIPATR